jgi:thiamine transporter
VVYFANYAPTGMSPIVYSILYNGSYMVPSIIISAIVIGVLQESKTLDIYK